MNNVTAKIEADVLLTKFSDYPAIKPEEYLLPENLTFGELEHPRDISSRKHMSETINPVIRVSNYKLKDDGIYGDIAFLKEDAYDKYKKDGYRFSFRAEGVGRNLIVHNWDMVSKGNFEKMMKEMQGQ